MEIAERLKTLIETSNDDGDFYDRTWRDFPVWTLAFLDDDYQRPMFLAKWQIDFANIIDAHRYIWAFTSRKAGKSTLLASKMAHYLCGPERHRISGFAPTHRQDFVYDRARQFLVRSPYLFNHFIENENADQTDMVNGSTFINRSISLTTKGSTARGEYGDIVYVDEIQEIEKRIKNQIIFPIVADAYSEKKIIMMGTPNAYRDPEIEATWNGWNDKSKGNDIYATFRVDCWRAIDEGCLSKEYVLEQQKGPNSLSPDEFKMEYEALFPDTSARWFPISVLHGLRTNRAFIDKPRPNRLYAMSVDWAKYNDRTQILVGEVDRDTGNMTYCYWQMYDPRRQTIDYEWQVEEVKRIFWLFDCEWICPDTTSIQDVLVELLFMDRDQRAIPKTAMYTEEADDKPRSDVHKWGYKASTARNFEMWRNHRQQMHRGRLHVPCEGPYEDAFWRLYEKEHHELIATPVQSSQFYRLEEPQGGSKDLAVAAAMLSLYLERFDKTPATASVGGW